MSDIHVFLSNLGGEMLPRLHVLQEDGLEESDEIHRVAKLSRSTFESYKWLIVSDTLAEPYHLIDEDPVLFIGRKFCRTRTECHPEPGETCVLVHKDDNVKHLNLETRYCTTIYSDVLVGLRIIDANISYPYWYANILQGDEETDTHIVFFYDTSRVSTESRFVRKTMSEVYVFLSNVVRDKVSQLQVLTEWGLEVFFNPDGEEDEPVKTWEDLEPSDGNYPVVKLSFSTFTLYKWLIVHDIECKRIKGEQPTTQYHLTDEEPIQFIRRNFCKSRKECNHKECDLVHNDDDNQHVNLKTRYCTTIEGADCFLGLRIIDANEEYPIWSSDMPKDNHPHDDSHVIFYFDTSEL